jgi:hypothetical protein
VHGRSGRLFVGARVDLANRDGFGCAHADTCAMGVRSLWKVTNFIHQFISVETNSVSRDSHGGRLSPTATGRRLQMLSHRVTRRPEKWATMMSGVKRRWMIPFRAFEWLWEWVAYALSHWSFLEVLEYMGSFSVLIGVIFYFSESGDRIKQRHYQAWQVINTAQGKGGSGGRIEALQELNEDHVPLVGVDVSSAFLQSIRLERANLLRANFNAADVRGGNLDAAVLSYTDLHAANFRGSHMAHASFLDADLHDADLVSANLEGANLDEADLSAVDLRSAKLKDIQWRRIRSVKDANIADVQDAPEGFVEWALKNGAVQTPDQDN